MRLKGFFVELTGSKCQICGYSKYEGCLEYHHVNPIEKEHEPAKLFAHNKIEHLIKEIPKCILLCSNCHKEVHANIAELPSDYDKLDVERFERESYRIMDRCPICGKVKLKGKRTCSLSCAAKSKVDWGSIDIFQMFVACSSVFELSKKIGFSDKTIRNKLKKEGLVYEL